MSSDKPPINLDDIDFGHTIRGHQKGDRVFERFILKKLLGRGGMGVVWMAKDERLNRDVALKFAPEVVRYDEVAVDELKEETLKGLNLAHPNIVKTYDFLLDEEHAAISMEFIDGDTLGSLRLQQPGKIFEPNQIAKWVIQLLDALEYAHNTGKVIHRDLKPANLMIDREGTLRVTDFGIARSISDAMNRATFGVENSTGTLAYMSPQQADGNKPHVTDDIYALGSTLYELLTGKPPFYSGNIATQLRDEKVMSLSERRKEFGVSSEPLPQEWEQAVLACLEKVSIDRPVSASAVKQRLGLGGPAIVIPLSAAPAQASVAMPPPLTKAAAEPKASPMADPGLTQIDATASPMIASKIRVGAVPAAEFTTSTQGTMEKSSNIVVWVILGAMVLTVAVLGAGGWWLYENTPFFKGKSSIVLTPQPKVDPKPPLVINTPPPKTDPKPDVKPEVKPEPPKVMPPTVPVPITEAITVTIPAGTEIQTAINEAKPGTTLIIPAGTYEEQLHFKNGVSLRAAEEGKVMIQTDGRVGSALMAENCQTGSITGIIFQHTGDTVTENVSWPVVMLKSSSITLEKCTVQAGVGNGLFITGASKPTILNCVLEKNTKNGLVLESGASAKITGTESRKNGESGVEVRSIGTHPSFEGGAYSDNALSGIVVKDGASASVSNQTRFTNNLEAGFLAVGDGVKATVTKGDFEGNLIGIAIQQGAFGSITGNKIRLSKEVGIQFDLAATNCEVSDNVIEKSNLDGILASGTKDTTLTLSRNTLTGNAGNGILIIGSSFKPRVSENTCSNNAQNGIRAGEGVAGTITQNIIRFNKMKSIDIQGASPELTIGTNTTEELK
ncbi:hypothetical protein BH11VER1_BH11VER1_11360 [soil metagenome]